MSSNRKITILGTDILPGKNYKLDLTVARLHTDTAVQIPLIIRRAKKEGPVLLIMAGTHGDEINGMEIVRQVIRRKINHPEKGTIICMPVFNIFGFLNVSRELPDGRDLNRSFPGNIKGSLASQFAYHFMKEIAPVTDYILDFHTGGALRSNYPQVRCVFEDEESMKLAQAFNPPFIVHSPYIKKSLRETMHKIGKKILLFEGGKSNSINPRVIKHGVEGVKRFIQHLEMNDFNEELEPDHEAVYIKSASWLRAPQSGVLRLFVENGNPVSKGELLAVVADPYGKMERKVKAPVDGYVFCVNTSPIVNRGDALFHIGKGLKSVDL